VAHHHHEEHPNSSARKRLIVALGIAFFIMVAEVVGGIISGSLALLSDTGHMLVDALAMGLNLFAITLACRPATATKTYGYHRAEIMAALMNGTILILVSAYIFYEAYQRLLVPPTIYTPIMLSVVVLGLLANLAAIFLLRSHAAGSLNIKAAFWHIMGDTLSSVGVIIAAIIIMVTGWYIADPIIAIVFGLVILWGAAQLVRESTDILLETVPKDVDIAEVIKLMMSTGLEVHDVHVWTITSGIRAMSAHLVINDQMVSKSTDVVAEVNREMAEHFNINHTTL
jgi:cobalt-zinc-cadmium efflux system protein